ncbi:hypothetical protein Trydic_g4244 [Trypoxylus dichotomus]
MSLITLCTAQLNILEEKLIHIFEDAKTIHESDNNRTVDIVVEEILKECIILHETISRIKEIQQLSWVCVVIQVSYLFKCQHIIGLETK